MLFTGRLTADAEVSTIKGDRKVTNFTVALNQRYKTKAGEKRERTAFIDCAYWINPGLADYLAKGAIVEVSGWVDAQPWKDRKGENHARLTCNVDSIKLFSSPAKAEAKTAAPEKGKNTVPMYDPVAAIDTTGVNGNNDDDLPF